MPSGDQVEVVRGPEASFFYDSACQLVDEYGAAMPGRTANVAKHAIFPDYFTNENIEGVMGRFRETGRLGSLKAVAGVEVFLDATRAPNLYLWRFWLHDCMLDSARVDKGMVELSHHFPHGYAVFARPDTSRAFYQDRLAPREVGFSVDVTDAISVLGNMTSFILNDPSVKNRLNQMLVNRELRAQHLLEEGVPLDGDPFRLPSRLGHAASERLLEYQQGFLSMIGYDSAGITEPDSLPKLVDLPTVPMVLSGLYRSLALDLAAS